MGTDKTEVAARMTGSNIESDERALQGIVDKIQDTVDYYRQRKMIDPDFAHEAIGFALASDAMEAAMLATRIRTEREVKARFVG